jgi:integrase
VAWRRNESDCWDIVVLPRLVIERLRQKSIDGYFHTYSLWLAYLRTLPPDQGATAPLAPADSHLITGFVDGIRVRTSAGTALIEGRRLKRLLTTFDAGAQTQLIDQVIERLQIEHKYTPKRSTPVVDSQALLKLGRQLIAAGEGLMKQCSSVKDSQRSGPTLYRDGIMIALLAMRPFRLRNFARLRLQRNLIIQNGIAWFRFCGEDTKNGLPLEIPYPRELFPPLIRYLRQIRREFIQGVASDYVWISGRGDPMNETAIRKTIKMRTTEALGYPVSPHRFRHAAVTFLATKHPELIAIAKDLLGHSHPAITEAHYNLALPQSAAVDVQQNLIAEAERIVVPNVPMLK